MLFNHFLSQIWVKHWVRHLSQTYCQKSRGFQKQLMEILAVRNKTVRSGAIQIIYRIIHAMYAKSAYNQYNQCTGNLLSALQSKSNGQDDLYTQHRIINCTTALPRPIHYLHAQYAQHTQHAQ